MPFWLDIAAFALKALLIVAAIGGLVFVVTLLTRGEKEDSSEIKIDSLNERYDAQRARLNAELLSKKERKALAKGRKKAAKSVAAQPTPKRIYVLDFKGDIRASAVTRLGREIDAVLTVARPEHDEVVVRIDSPGGSASASDAIWRAYTDGVRLWFAVAAAAVSSYGRSAVAMEVHFFENDGTLCSGGLWRCHPNGDWRLERLVDSSASSRFY